MADSPDPFGPLPPQGRFETEAANAYAATALARSRAAARAHLRAYDIRYGPDPWQSLDIYAPQGDHGRDLPVLVFLHGGGWTKGYKEWAGFMAPAMVDLPALLVSVSYRLAPAVRHPAPLDDTLDALAWIHRHIEHHGGRPGSLLVGGHSAGGHLAALATMRHDLWPARGMPANLIRACLPLCTTFDFREEHREALLGTLFEDEAAADDAAPLKHLARVRGASLSRFLIAWGEADLLRVRETSAEMVEALLGLGSAVERMVFPGTDHFEAHLATGDADHPWTRRVRQLLRD